VIAYITCPSGASTPNLPTALDLSSVARKQDVAEPFPISVRYIFLKPHNSAV
jgi:hypothetical protein